MSSHQIKSPNCQFKLAREDFRFKESIRSESIDFLIRLSLIDKQRMFAVYIFIFRIFTVCKSNLITQCIFFLVLEKGSNATMESLRRPTTKTVLKVCYLVQQLKSFTSMT